MPTTPRSRIARTMAGAAVGLAVAGALAACSSSSSTSSAPAASGSSAAAGSASASSGRRSRRRCRPPTTLTWWAWAPQDKQLVTAFEKLYPKVKVNLVNAGTGTAEYTKLQNAIKAGSGVPDIAQIEYYALPQFALGGSLANLEQRRPRQRPEPVQLRGVGLGELGRRTGRPAAGHRADGAVLQQDDLRQVRADGADHVGAVRRRREEAARRQPEGVHHQRHRRPRLHHLDDLGRRRPPVRHQRHQERHDRPVRPGHAEVRQHVEPAGLRRPGRADLARGAPSGTRVCPTGTSRAW